MNARHTALLCTIALVTSSALAQQRPSQEFNGSPARSAHAHATGRILLKWRADAAR